jgi:hypothetical protein
LSFKCPDKFSKAQIGIIMLTEKYPDKRSLVSDLNDFTWAVLRMHDVADSTALTEIRIGRSDGSGPQETLLLPLSEMQSELRRLIEMWHESGPNLGKLFRKYPELEEKTRWGKTRLRVMPDGAGYLDWEPVTPDNHLVTDKADFASDSYRALGFFMMLITNPLSHLLAGPCATSGCGRYFDKESKRARKYCSPECGSAATAAAAVNKGRREKNSRKVRIAQRSIAKWKRGSRKADWKRSVVRDTSGQNDKLTMNWLTRAVRRGDIADPQLEAK